MSFCATGNLSELFLRYTLHEPVQAGKHLSYILGIHDIHLRPSNQRLDARQALPNQMLTQPLINLLQHQPPELLILTLLHIKDGIDEPALLQLIGREALAHDQRLIGLGDAEAVDECAGGTALCDEAEGGEGGQEEGARCTVDEVGKGGQGGGEADDGAVEAEDEDLGVF